MASGKRPCPRPLVETSRPGGIFFASRISSTWPSSVRISAVVEAVVFELVGDLEHDVAVAAALDPLRDVDHRGTHRGLVGQHLVLPLVEAAEDHHQARPVARLDDPPPRGPGTTRARSHPARTPSYRPLVTGHPALEVEREGLDAVRGIVGHVREEPVGVGFRVAGPVCGGPRRPRSPCACSSAGLRQRAPIGHRFVDEPRLSSQRYTSARRERVLVGQAQKTVVVVVGGSCRLLWQGGRECGEAASDGLGAAARRRANSASRTSRPAARHSPAACAAIASSYAPSAGSNACGASPTLATVASA